MWDFSNPDVTFDNSEYTFDGGAPTAAGYAGATLLRMGAADSSQGDCGCANPASGVPAVFVFPVSQIAGQTVPYGVDVSLLTVSEWAPGAHVAANALVRPTQERTTGWLYQQTAAAGQTGSIEPKWPVAANGTVADGSCNWTAVAPLSAGQDTIASTAWVVSGPDSALTITTPKGDKLTTWALISGGTSGKTYSVAVQLTMASGAVYIAQIDVTVQ